MAIAERIRESRLFHSLSAKETRRTQPPPKETLPIYSAAYLENLERQRELDRRLGGAVETGPRQRHGYGQDKEVSVVSTTQGELVVKTLKDTSRPHMIFGLGISASDIPPDTDTTRAREALVEYHSGTAVDPYAVAEKMRIAHTMAMTHLDRGEGLILPTAVTVEDGNVQNRQRFLPRLGPVGVINRDPVEIAIEEREKVKLFRELQERWKRMIGTPDFRSMPEDVQDYMRTFPPDSGYGTNAHFFGLGHVVAIDY